MKYRILLAAFLALSSFTVAASKDRTGPEISAGVGEYFYQDSSTDDASMKAISLGFNLNNTWAIEAIFGDPDTTFSPQGDLNVDWRALRGLYHLKDEGNIVPYVSAGFDSLKTFKTNRAIVLGVGLKAYVTDNITLRLETNYHSDEGDQSILAMVGYRFGDSRPMRTEPQDRDKDGVMDNRDACPKTPMGSKVDDRGCVVMDKAPEEKAPEPEQVAEVMPVDTDGDGVYDNQDKCPDTPAGALVDDSGCQQELDKEVSVNLAITFASNSDVVDARFDSELAKVADFMKQYAGTNVVIEGHTDSTGAAAYNQTLSERRAASVANALAQRFDIDPGRISSVGYGETRLIASDDTPEGRQANRRVVAVINQTVTEKQWQE